MYKSFQRSTETSQFLDYTYDDANIAWIDILNVRKKPHSEVTAIMRKVLDLPAEATSTGPIFEDGVYVGTPNSGELCDSQKRDLLDSAFHELQHYKDGFWKSNFYENFGPQSPVNGVSQRHYDIYTNSSSLTDKYINQYLGR